MIGMENGDDWGNFYILYNNSKTKGYSEVRI